MAIPVKKIRGMGARDINWHEDCFEINSMEKDVCIKCGRDGKLLICCAIDCPIAVHEKCVGCRAKYDDLGNFYCPHCSYKQAVADSSQARVRAMLAKKALSRFIDQEIIHANPQKEKTVTAMNKWFTLPVFKENDNENTMETEAFQNQDVPSREDHQELAFAPECTTNNLSRKGADVSVGNKRSGFSLNGCDEEEDPSASSLVEETTLDGALHILTKQKLNDEGVFEKNGDRREVEKEIWGQEHQTGQVLLKANRGAEAQDSFSRDANINAKQNDKEISQHLNLGSPKRSPGESSSVLRNSPIQKEIIINSNKLPQHEKLYKQRINVSSSNVRRKKLPWKDEEEEMIKEGVHKFSSTVNNNIPWRKILDFGRHVFDGTRNPADLKDKWRNLSKSKSTQKNNK